MKMSTLGFYTQREERANYLTHALGMVITLAATIFLTHKANAAHNGWAVGAFILYGLGAFVCMSSSTLYHYAKNPDTKALLRHFDHGSIYLSIASSYSPFCLILLRNQGLWGWGIFGLVWVVALIGITISMKQIKKNSNLKTASYVLMGMIFLIAIKPSVAVAQQENCLWVLYWLLIGGGFYIIGAFIYALGKREFSHAVFHVFVLLGMACHILAATNVPV